MTSPRVILVGQMGAGKTTLGALLAERWAGQGWRLRDLDAVIVEQVGYTIPEIFATRGEAGFRAVEAMALTQVLTEDRVIVATGGGAPCQPGAMDRILAAGTSVWLRAAPAVLAQRVAGPGRPLLAGCDRPAAVRVLQAQLASRGPCYARADVIVDVDDLAPTAAADAVIAGLLAQGLVP